MSCANDNDSFSNDAKSFITATQHGASVLLSIYDTYILNSVSNYTVQCIPLCDWIILPTSYNTSLYEIWIHHLNITNYNFYVQTKNDLGAHYLFLLHN